MTKLLRTAAVGLAALLIAGVGACSNTAGTATPPPLSSSLRQALSWIPSQVTQCQFFDIAAAKKRWGMSEINGKTPTDGTAWHEYLQKRAATSVGSTLDNFDYVMSDWGWNGADIDWEATWLSKDGASTPPSTVDKVRDGLDMQVVVKSLKAHRFIESGSGDTLRFDRPIADAGTVTIFLQGVTVIPSKHLLITTSDKSFAMPAAGSSLATKADIGTLIGTLPTVDYLAVATGSSACVKPGALRAGLTPEQRSAMSKALHLDRLKPITGSAVAVIDDTHAAIRTEYANQQTAAADVATRKALMGGRSILTQDLYSQRLSATIAAAGNILTYQLAASGKVMIVGQMVQTGDTPWAFCG